MYCAPTVCETTGEIVIQKKQVQNELKGIFLRCLQSNEDDRHTISYIIIHVVHKYLFGIYYVLDMRLGTSSLKVNKPQIPAFMELTFKLGKQAIMKAYKKNDNVHTIIKKMINSRKKTKRDL